jgi:hypothetical protein
MTDTHEVAARKEEEVERLRRAFGISEDHREVCCWVVGGWREGKTRVEHSLKKKTNKPTKMTPTPTSTVTRRAGRDMGPRGAGAAAGGARGEAQGGRLALVLCLSVFDRLSENE